jgi:hypothetical protein
MRVENPAAAKLKAVILAALPCPAMKIGASVMGRQCRKPADASSGHWRFRSDPWSRRTIDWWLHKKRAQQGFVVKI